SGEVLPAVISVEVNLWCLVLSALGGYQNHTVCRPEPIYRSGGILQDGYVFDIIHIQVVELAAGLGNAVDNKQRFAHVPDLEYGRGSRSGIAFIAIGRTGCDALYFADEGIRGGRC